jgi:ribosomal protein S20
LELTELWADDSGDTLRNEQTATAIRRVVRTELEACATAINRNDKKASLDQLAEASAKLRRIASGLIGKFG